MTLVVRCLILLYFFGDCIFFFFFLCFMLKYVKKGLLSYEYFGFFAVFAQKQGKDD